MQVVVEIIHAGGRKRGRSPPLFSEIPGGAIIYINLYKSPNGAHPSKIIFLSPCHGISKVMIFKCLYNTVDIMFLSHHECYLSSGFSSGFEVALNRL